MKFKHFYPLLAVFAFSGAYAQVGINTSNPQSTFDIVGNGASTSTKDGVTGPRVTRQQLAAKVAGTYAAAQTGTLVFITDATTPTGTTPSLAQTVNVSRAGYHYFDGTAWKQLNDPDNTTVSTNIYNSDGVLSGNRIVSQLANTLTFNATTNNAFTINRSNAANPIFSVDAANDRVGIGSNIPRSRFEIVSDNAGSGSGNDFNFTGYGSSKNPALFLASSGGTAATPANLLLNDIIGSIYFSPRVNGAFPNGSMIISGYRGDGTTSLTDLAFSTSGTERVRIDPTGNVGIGTGAPSAKLDVQGNQNINAALTLGNSNNAIDINIAQDNVTYGNRNANFGINVRSVASVGGGPVARMNFGDNSVTTAGAGKYFSFNVGNINELIYLTSINSGRVGIGTITPGAKLEVNSGGTSTTPIAAIKIVDGNEAAGKILTSDGNGLATWQDAATQASVNIYNSDGVLSGNRIVSQLSNTLTFNGSVANAFSINRSNSSNPLFSVDAANDRVGIATTAPRSRFEILSDNAGNGSGNDFNFSGYGSSKNPAIFLSSAGGTLAVPTNLVAGDLTGSLYFTGRANNTNVNSIISSAYRGDGTTALTDLMFATSNTERMRIDPTGNVGIGTTTPTNLLDLGMTNGAASVTAAAGKKLAVFNNTAGTDFYGLGINTNYLQFHAGSVATAAPGMVLGTSGNVGIGNTAPAVRLDINSGGTSTTPVTAVKIVDGNQAAGRVLTSDASGLATWQDAASGASTNIYNADGVLAGNRIVSQVNRSLAFNGTIANSFSVNRSTAANPILSVDAANDRVGISTNAPVAKVDIVGSTFGMKMATGSGSWDNIWFNLTSSIPSINVSGAENGLQFNVGTNSTGTYGDGQTLTTVATMRANGNMGIGTTNPLASVHVATDTEGIINEKFASGGGAWPAVILRRSGSATVGTNAAVASGSGLGALVFSGNTGAGYSADYMGTSSSIRSNSTQAFSAAAQGSNMTFFTVQNGTNAATQRMILTHDGNVGIGTNTPSSMLSVNGTADKPGGGSWGTFSDQRVKKDINEFKDGLNVINQLKPVVYKYNEKSGYTDLNKQYVGFIAQDVEKAAPYMVNIIDDSAKSGLKDKRELDESALTKILVNAVKEQQKEIELLKAQVNELLELNKKK